MTTRRLGPLALLCALAAPTARAADAPIVVERLRVGLSEVPTEGVFKEGTWTPVAVDLAAGPARFVGFLEVLAPDDDGTAVVARVPIDLKAKETRTYTTYLRPGVKASNFAARAVDESGRPRGKERDESGADWIDASQTVVALLGNPRGVEEVAGLQSFLTPSITGGGSELRVIRVRPPRGAMSPGSVPGRWYGYDIADVVVLDTADDAIMADLADGGKASALEEWVRQGGHLVVAGATRTQMLADNAILRRMLPAVPTESLTLNDLGALESYAGSARFGRNVRALSVARLEVAPGHSAQVLASTVGGTPTNLVVRGAWGFGRVTILGVDAGLSPFADWAGAKDLWVKVLDLRGRPADSPGSPAPYSNGAFYQGGTRDLAGVLQQSLERFPGVKLVPFGVVAGFVFLYILLIGPGDYFFLKKVLKRMELTWVTFPLIVVGVSTAAYLAAYAIKGSDLRVNKVDAVDIDQSGPGEPALRGHSWVSLFSPHNRDYGVAFDPKPLDADAPAAAPAKGDRSTLVSWFASPEPTLRAGTGAGMGGSSYRQAPTNESEALEGVRVAIWSTKGFGARWSGTSARAVDADLTPVGGDRLTGTVVNRLKKPLRDAWVAFGNQVYLLGDITPGASTTVELAPNRVLASLLEERSGVFLRDLTSGVRMMPTGPNVASMPLAGPAPAARADAIRVAMFRDLLATRPGALSSVPLRDLDMTGQLALGRPILVATVDGEGSSLRLSGNDRPPILERETVLRVILPLNPEAPGN